jgi:hypothetical protein
MLQTWAIFGDAREKDAPYLRRCLSRPSARSAGVNSVQIAFNETMSSTEAQLRKKGVSPRALGPASILNRKIGG